jgi:ABC-type transporter Mla subunit MlaD
MKRHDGGHWKLGLFVLGGMVAGVGLILWLGMNRLSRHEDPYVTWFDQSVGDLESGSDVVFRGVIVGRVVRVSIDEGRRIRVQVGLFRNQLQRLGMDPKGPPPPDARLKLGMGGGLTGGGQMELVFVDPAQNPAPDLDGIQPPPNYIPSLPARFTSLGSAVGYVADQVGPAVEDVRKILDEVRRKVESIDTAQMNADALEALQSFRQAAGAVSQLADDLAGQGGPLQHTLRNIEDASAHVDRAIAHLQVEKTSEAVRQGAQNIANAANRYAQLAGQVETELSALRGTLEAIRRLADLIERNPSVLIRGRTPSTGGP